MRVIIILTLWQISFDVSAQLTGKVTLSHAGMEFTIPQGWLGQETGMGYILGSQTEAGAIFLTSHESSTLELMKQEAMKGIHDEGGTQLMPEGSLATLTENSIAGNYGGTLQGQAVKAFGVGLINPFGRGVTILAVSTPEMFADRHRALAKEIAKSFRFFKAETSPLVDEWRNALSNARLTYMESYNTSGGGYSDKIVIDLCATGHFRHSKRYNMGVDTGGAFANDHNASRGSGAWSIAQDASGNPLLELKFSNGDVSEYTLGYVDEKTLLNGIRYFRTYDAACPD